MVRELAYLQDRYPDIAVAVKTRRAARHILNTSRSELNDLKKGGLLDDTVYQTLHRKIQVGELCGNNENDTCDSDKLYPRRYFVSKICPSSERWHPFNAPERRHKPKCCLVHYR